MNDIHGYVGAYVAHALDEELRIVFAEHLEDCESCSREVQEFRETLAQLSSLSATRPPSTLRNDVLGAISEIRIDPPDEPAVGRAAWAPDSLRDEVLAVISQTPLEQTRRESTGTDRTDQQPTEDDPKRSEVVSLDSARKSRATRLLSFAVAASVIIAVLFESGLLGVYAH